MPRRVRPAAPCASSGRFPGVSLQRPTNRTGACSSQHRPSPPCRGVGRSRPALCVTWKALQLFPKTTAPQLLSHISAMTEKRGAVMPAASIKGEIRAHQIVSEWKVQLLQSLCRYQTRTTDSDLWVQKPRRALICRRLLGLHLHSFHWSYCATSCKTGVNAFRSVYLAKLWWPHCAFVSQFFTYKYNLETQTVVSVPA